MKNRKRFVRGIGIAAAGVILLAVVLTVWIRRMGADLTLERIAYDRSRKNPVVYIKEEDAYVPYLVLTADYDGNVLLLRENLLPEAMQYKEHSEFWASYEYGAYYEESSIDEFLNTEFLDVFSPEVQSAILDTTIEVTDLASYEEETWGEATHRIERKVFLLSAVELGVVYSVGYNVTKEGTPLKYFKNKDYAEKRAYMADGTAWPYWTRTPWIWEECLVTMIGVNYSVLSAPASSRSGVRPAFCMGRDTVVQKRDDIIAGETVYILELDGG